MVTAYSSGADAHNSTKKPFVFSSTVISASAGSTMLRVLSVCGAIGVSRIREASGETIGPPAERLYPVDPVGVEMMMPSAL